MEIVATVLPGQETQSFHHEASFYSDQDEFLAATVPFLKEGLERDESMLVALDRPKIEAVVEELNGDAERVRFVDMQRVGRNPARIIPIWRDFVEQNADNERPMRGIGEQFLTARAQRGGARRMPAPRGAAEPRLHRLARLVAAMPL